MASRPNPIKEAITAYKSAVTRVRGKSAASRTSISYSNGWFTVVDADGSTRRLRRRQILFFAETMEALPKSRAVVDKPTRAISGKTTDCQPPATCASNESVRVKKGILVFGLGLFTVLASLWIAHHMQPPATRSSSLSATLTSSPAAKIDATHSFQAQASTTVGLETKKLADDFSETSNQAAQTKVLNYRHSHEGLGKLKKLIENKFVKTHRGVMNHTELIRELDETNRTLSYIQSIFIYTPNGSLTTRSRFQVPLDQVAFERSRIEPTTGSDVQLFKLVIPTIADAPVISAKLTVDGSGAYSDQTTKNPENVPMPEFGFAFSTLQEAAEVRDLFVEIYAGTTNQTKTAAEQTKKSRDVIMGSTKEQVDALLKDWSIRQSNRATPSTPMYYYGKDVEIMVKFRDGKAVGAAVVDRPRVGVSPIPQNRFEELTELIGGMPITRDILRDAQGIREFSVGDAD